MDSEGKGRVEAEAAPTLDVIPPSAAALSLRKALEEARDKLLDRSLRNKLISTNLASERAKQIRVFGARSGDILQRLRGGRVAAFAMRGDGDPERSEPTPVRARNRSALPSGDMARKLDMIDEAELAAAALVALEQNLALRHEEWITETARLLGFSRLGKDVAAAIEAAIHGRLEGQIERDHLDRWKLKTG